MLKVEELQNKRAELEVQYNNLVKLDEQKREQFKKDIQDIRDTLNSIRGEYKVYSEIIEQITSEAENDTKEEKKK